MQLAYFDELTGLPNRRLFNDRLSMALASAHRDKQMLAVMFIDLDRFKEVNDSLGHNAGDTLLKLVSERIINTLNEGGYTGTIRGDEFIVLCEVESVAAVIRLAEGILNHLNTPLNWKDLKWVLPPL